MAIGGLTAIGAIAAYEGNWAVVSAVVTALAAYLMAKVYASSTARPPS